MTCKGRSTQAKTLLQTESDHENQQQATKTPGSKLFQQVPRKVRPPSAGTVTWPAGGIV
jgi:hypothetical protein